MDVARRVTFLRETKGLTVYKLGKISDISSSYLREIEKGKKCPSIEVVERICKAVELNLADFFNDSENQHSPEILELINNAKKLNRDQLRAFNEMLKTIS